MTDVKLILHEDIHFTSILNVMSCNGFLQTLDIFDIRPIFASFCQILVLGFLSFLSFKTEREKNKVNSSGRVEPRGDISLP